MTLAFHNSSDSGELVCICTSVITDIRIIILISEVIREKVVVYILYGKRMRQVKCMDDSGMQAGHVNTGVLGSCSCMAAVRA
jgi:hypothetical protein